jgi:Protein of unknown function (DUF2934)
MSLISKPPFSKIRGRLAEVRARLALRIAQHWPRAKELSLDAWKRSAPAREWISHHPNLVIAPAMVVTIIVLLIVRQVAVAGTLIGALVLFWLAAFLRPQQIFDGVLTRPTARRSASLQATSWKRDWAASTRWRNISKESSDDYWTVMEHLTAFVRERTRRTERRIAECAYLLWEKAGRPDGRDQEFWDKAVEQETQGNQVAADIAAVLEVIRRSQGRHFEWRRPPGGASRRRQARGKGRVLRAPISPRRISKASTTSTTRMAMRRRGCRRGSRVRRTGRPTRETRRPEGQDRA